MQPPRSFQSGAASSALGRTLGTSSRIQPKLSCLANPWTKDSPVIPCNISVPSSSCNLMWEEWVLGWWFGRSARAEVEAVVRGAALPAVSYERRREQWRILASPCGAMTTFAGMSDFHCHTTFHGWLSHRFLTFFSPLWLPVLSRTRLPGVKSRLKGIHLKCPFLSMCLMWLQLELRQDVLGENMFELNIGLSRRIAQK